MFVCEHDEIIGCVKADVLSTCQFDFILIYVWFKQYVPKYSSDKVNAIQSKRKVSGSAAHVSVKLIKMQMKGIS
jgi:hypothetical protein